MALSLYTEGGVTSADPMAKIPMLGSELKVSVTDGRCFVGILTAVDGEGNIVLRDAFEKRIYRSSINPDKQENVLRPIMLCNIHAQDIVSIHRRVGQVRAREEKQEVVEEDVAKKAGVELSQAS